ncbi:MAG: repeat-containing protein, partial [Gemmatimonadetes bacterium]|nr:repeat-containing protein [Gemmatimonadota bacterium]
MPLSKLSLALILLAAAGCAGTSATTGMTGGMSTAAPSPDPRVGLRAGLFDAQEATWNMRVVSETRPSERFVGITNSDLAFTGPYAIQGSYNGYQVWDISNPAHPTLKTAYVCPASQSDVSVYRNLLFVSGEGLTGRIDCGTQGVRDTVSRDRLRGLRIFDISDISNPRNIA